MRRLIPCLCALSLVAGACSSPRIAQVRGDTVTAPRHVFVIVLENHGLEQIYGSSRAPYLNSLASRYGIATNYAAITHPSLPNYLAMTGGSTFGITNDCTSCSVRGLNIGAQLSAKGVTWKGYMEGMPSPCYSGASYGRYAKKHNPFAYFSDFTSDVPACRAHVVPLTAFGRDVAARTVPYLSFIVPDGCHDMHDCSIATGDAWLRSFVPQILGSSAFRDNGILVITFDENSGARGNRVATLVAGPRVRTHASSARAFTHYSLLRSLEDLYGVARLGHARDVATLDLLRVFGA